MKLTLVGSIGGSALTVDDHPNTTPPAANRIVRMSGPLVTPRNLITTVLDGNGLTVAPYLLDEGTGKWFSPFQIPMTGDYSNAFAIVTAIQNYDGWKSFMRVTVNGASTKCFGWWYG